MKKTLLAEMQLLLIALLPTCALGQTTTDCRPDGMGGFSCTERQPATGIDFNAFNRGRRQAELENMQDEVFRQQQELLELQRSQLLKQQEATTELDRQAQESEFDLKADLFLSNIASARNTAIAGGMTPSDFWNGTYRQMLADNEFLSMPQEMQEVVLAKFKRLHDRLETKF